LRVALRSVLLIAALFSLAALASLFSALPLFSRSLPALYGAFVVVVQFLRSFLDFYLSWVCSLGLMDWFVRWLVVVVGLFFFVLRSVSVLVVLLPLRCCCGSYVVLLPYAFSLFVTGAVGLLPLLLTAVASTVPCSRTVALCRLRCAFVRVALLRWLFGFLPLRFRFPEFDAVTVVALPLLRCYVAVDLFVIRCCSFDFRTLTRYVDYGAGCCY